jgi:hypothetical protein
MWGPIFMEGIIIIHQVWMRFSIFMAGAVSDMKNYGMSKNVVHAKNMHVGRCVCAHPRFLRKILKFERK